MAGVIMAVLGLLAAEDLKYKAVTVGKLVLFGLVCTIQAVRTGILRQSIEADTFLGVLFGVMVLLICVWTKQLGAADGIIILFLFSMIIIIVVAIAIKESFYLYRFFYMSCIIHNR